jgi:hypothetical protein
MSTLAEWQKQDWVHIWIDGQLLEGIYADVKGTPYSRLIEVGGSVSTENKLITDRGSAPGTWVIVLKSPSKDAMADAFTLLTAKTEQEPIDVWHALMNVFNVDKIYIKSISAELVGPEMIMTLDCTEYAVKKPTATKQRQPTSNQTLGQVNDKNSPVLTQMNSLGNALGSGVRKLTSIF